MNKLLILSGVPGSGKSYFTSIIKKMVNGHVYVVSSDSLRELIGGSVTNFDNEDLMWKMYYDLIKVYSDDKNGIVISDSTNLYKKHRYENVKEVSKYFDEVDLVTFNIDKNIVAFQNLTRPHPVSGDVIEDMYKKYESVDEEEKSFFKKVLYITCKEDFPDVVNKIMRN